MKKLLLILICLFVSSEAKSKNIVFGCEIKKTVHKINDSKGKFIKNILDTSFDMETLYLDEKNQWMNFREFKRDEYDYKIELDNMDNMIVKELDYIWNLRVFGDRYSYRFKSDWHLIEIDLNKESGYLEHRQYYVEVIQLESRKHFYKKGYWTKGFNSYGVCKKIKKSLF